MDGRASLASVVSTRLREGFVGRAAELARLEAIHHASRQSPQLVTVSGPAGVGKSLLARRFAVEVAGRAVFMSQGQPVASTAPRLGDSDEPDLVVVDGAAIDSDGCVRLLDQLGQTCGPRLSVLICTRSRAVWRARVDPGLGELMNEIHLANLSAAESAELLAKKGLAGSVCDDLFALTGGHPLALALLAERQRVDPGLRASWTGAPDLVALLVREFLADAPSASHREVLLLASLIDPLEEAAAAEILGRSVREEFAWIWESPLAEMGPSGVELVPIAREVLGRAARRDPHARPLLEKARVRVSGAPGPARPDGPAFSAAVRAVLAAFQRPHELAESPLLGAALMPAADVPAMLALLRSVIEEMATQSGYERDARVLSATFLEPNDKQHAVAANLGMPYGTYRHRLRSALSVLCDLLWQREIAARTARGEPVA